MRLIFLILLSCHAITLLFCHHATAQLPSGNWQYHWGDDFSGTTLDTTKWSYNYPWGSTHNHDAVMNPGNVLVADGTLTLEARRNGAGGDFTSGAISTGYNRFTFDSGYVEASIKLPTTPGSWPAFWGLFDGWPPEADIMEYPIDTAAGNGYNRDEYHTAFHYRNSSGGNSAGAGKVNPSGIGDLSNSYHNFGMHWIKDDWVGFYFNGQLVSQFGNDSAIAQMERMYLILNYAVGGWPGRPSTSEWAVGHTDQMKVDFVRVWKDQAALSTQWSNLGTGEYMQWDDTANWSNGSPNLGGATASFDTVAGVAEQRIDWSGRRTVSVVNLDGDTRYRFGWPDDRLVLGYGNSGSTLPAINIAATSTAEHEIYSELELAGGVGITNESSEAFLLTGEIMGAGTVRVNGPGVVSFDGDNTYSGNTVIDSGTQGFAIARARGQNAFGLGGRVTIGEGGNSTTGRMELEAGSLVSNQVTLNGRNNSTSGIRNNGDSNIISGTVSTGVGGANYIIESAAGLLTLSGSNSEAGGVSISSHASGTRTVTLTGAGAGLVEGTIENGSATTSITKAGGGSWGFSGTNTYTGRTLISEGRLFVNGAHEGAGDYQVDLGAALGGDGVIDLGTSSTFNVDGRLAPGNSIGKLTIGSATSPDTVVIGDTGELQIEIGASGQSDLLQVFGTLDLSSESDTLSLVSLAGAFDGSEYLIASFDPGTLGADVFNQIILDGQNLGSTPVLGNGYQLNYDSDQGFLSLVAVPEPTTGTVLIALGLIATLRNRRRVS